VAFEDSFLFFTESFAGLDLNRFQLSGGFGATTQETFNFLINLIGRNFFPVDDNFIFFQPKAIPGDAKMPEIITLPYL